MKKLIFIIGIYLTYVNVTGFLDSLHYPAFGDVSQQYVRIVPENSGEATGTATTTTTGTSTSTADLPETEPEKPFEPLPFDGKVGKFQKKYGGEIVSIEDTKFARGLTLAQYKFKSKGVLINGDLYFVAKGGNTVSKSEIKTWITYVIHKGKLIRINP